VDGVRFDFLGPRSAPSVWALGQAGFLAPVPVDEATPTWSGPCWATIATGTGVAGHGVTGNDLTGHRLAEHPDFVTLGGAAGSGGSRLPSASRVSAQPRTTPVPTVAPPTASVKVCAGRRYRRHAGRHERRGRPAKRAGH
jgi:hypothetical protein